MRRFWVQHAKFKCLYTVSIEVRVQTNSYDYSSLAEEILKSYVVQNE